MKNLFALVFTISCLMLYGQTQDGIEFGVSAGINMSNFNQDFNDPADETPFKSRIGYQFGITASKNISEQIFIGSGLTYISKGAALDLEREINDPAVTVNGYYRRMLNYLSVPITVGYNISDNIDLSAGAYVAFGLSGEDKWDYEINDGGLETVQGSEDITFSRDEISGNNSEEVRGLDYGLRISAGYNLNPVQLTLFMENGFANLTPYDPQDPGYDPDTEKVSNFTLGLSIKYILNN